MLDCEYQARPLECYVGWCIIIIIINVIIIINIMYIYIVQYKNKNVKTLNRGISGKNIYKLQLIQNTSARAVT